MHKQFATRLIPCAVLLVAALFAPATLAMAASTGPEITRNTVDGGGGTSSNGNISLTGTIGQHDATPYGAIQSASMGLTGGFWSKAPLPPSLAIVSGPVAIPTSGKVNVETAFSATAVVMNSNATANYNWNFGDGSAEVSGPNVTHTYQIGGTFTVKVTAQAGALLTSSTLDYVVAELPLLQKVKASVKLVFTFGKSNQDAVTFSGTVHIPALFTPLNKKVTAGIQGLQATGGLQSDFFLNAKSVGTSGANSVTLKITSKKGVVSAQESAFTVKFSKGTFSPAFTGLFINDTVKKNVDAYVFMTVDGVAYRVKKTFAYTCKKNATGTATAK